MSTGKRLAKRSIVGSKVVVLREDGFYYPGVIQAVKTAEMDQVKGQGLAITKYAVRLDANRQLREYSEVDLIGPGFQNTSGITLKAGQRVYVTFAGREVAGHVTKHRPDVDEVYITVQGPGLNTVEIVKRMEEIRLMESRKSLRLMDQHDVDFARLAEGTTLNGHNWVNTNVNYDPPRKRSSHSTSGIDVPGAHVGSRKRRSSPTCDDVIMDEDGDSDVMDECTAAMVLMRLSCSPHSPRWEELAAWQSSQSSSSSGAFSWRGSVSSSSDSPPHAGTSGTTNRKLKFRSATPSPPLSGSAPASFLGGSSSSSGPLKFNSAHDDGIVSDESISESDEGHPGSGNRRVIYQCTWPGCSTATSNCAAIESHVRNLHLGPRKVDEELSDHEEEFYYTEVEDAATEEDDVVSQVTHSTVSTNTTNIVQPGHVLPGLFASSPPTLSHMDMVRPPHEDPEYHRHLYKAARPIAIPARVRSISWSSGYGYGSYPQKQAKVAGVANSKGVTSTFSVKTSPVRRPRGEAKKCRKVYGMEHRELWCTQCKWKKACTRFGD